MPGSHRGPQAMLVYRRREAFHSQFCPPQMGDPAVKEFPVAKGRITGNPVLLAFVNRKGRFQRTGPAAASQKKSTTTSGGGEPVKASRSGSHHPGQDNRSSMVGKQADPVILAFQLCFGSGSYPFRMLAGWGRQRHEVHRMLLLKILTCSKEAIYNKREHKQFGTKNAMC